jgi:hypothetical protein
MVFLIKMPPGVIFFSYLKNSGVAYNSRFRTPVDFVQRPWISADFVQWPIPDNGQKTRVIGADE